MFKQKGGGVNGFLNNVKKNAPFLHGRFPYCVLFKLLVKRRLPPILAKGRFLPRMGKEFYVWDTTYTLLVLGALKMRGNLISAN